MNRYLSSELLGITISALILLTFAAPVTAIPWSHAFQLESAGGTNNPAILVGFNPQPEPPARLSELSFAFPPDPILLLRDQSNQQGGLQIFDVFLALSLRTMRFSYSDPVITDGTASTVRTQATADGVALFEIFFDISSSSGGIIDPTSLVGFNPQPEPPARFGGAFGMSFGINSLSDAMVAMRILDANGTTLTLRPIPEPGSAVLTGLALLALSARSRHRAPPGIRS